MLKLPITILCAGLFINTTMQAMDVRNGSDAKELALRRV